MPTLRYSSFRVHYSTSSMSIAIRAAVVEDIPNLLPMIAKICDFHRSRDPARYGFLPQVERMYPKWIRGMIANQQDLCLVAEDDAIAADSKLVAFLIAELETEVPIYEVKHYGYIHDLWVEADYRRLGLAKQLVMQAIEHFRQVGVPQVRLTTLVENQAAQRLYESCGFRSSTIEMLVEID